MTVISTYLLRNGPESSPDARRAVFLTLATKPSSEQKTASETILWLHSSSGMPAEGSFLPPGAVFGPRPRFQSVPRKRPFSRLPGAFSLPPSAAKLYNHPRQLFFLPALNARSRHAHVYDHAHNLYLYLCACACLSSYSCAYFLRIKKVAAGTHKIPL